MELLLIWTLNNGVVIIDTYTKVSFLFEILRLVKLMIGSPCKDNRKSMDKYSYTHIGVSTFKFGRRVHFALRRKMLKPPIARLPVI